MTDTGSTAPQDPHALPPEPTPAQKGAAKMATLDAEAISPEALHLQQMLATMVLEFEDSTDARKRRRTAAALQNFERAIGALLADVLEAPRSEPQAGLVYRSLSATALSKVEQSNTALSKGPQTYDALLGAVAALKDRGLMEHFPGERRYRNIDWGDGVSSTEELGKAARFRATPMNRFSSYLGAQRPWENRLRPVLDILPRSKVKAGDPDELAKLGYRRGECHTNCRRATAADPLMQQVVGWTVTRNAYHLHSVLRAPGGGLHCITPDHTDELDVDGLFDFVIDDEFTLEGAGPFLRRDGEYANPIMHALIRRDVENCVRHHEALLERVRHGELTCEEAALLRADWGS